MNKDSYFPILILYTDAATSPNPRNANTYMHNGGYYQINSSNELPNNRTFKVISTRFSGDLE